MILFLPFKSFAICFNVNHLYWSELSWKCNLVFRNMLLIILLLHNRKFYSSQRQPNKVFRSFLQTIIQSVSLFFLFYLSNIWILFMGHRMLLSLPSLQQTVFEALLRNQFIYLIYYNWFMVKTVFSKVTVLIVLLIQTSVSLQIGQHQLMSHHSKQFLYHAAYQPKHDDDSPVNDAPIAPITPISPLTFNLVGVSSYFVLPMTIEGYDYKMFVDTGSSTTYIKGEKATGLPVRRYKMTSGNYKSKDYKKITIEYASTKVETYLPHRQFTVKLGTLTFNQSFLVSYKGSPQDDQIEGLIGLGPKIKNRNPNPQFLQALVKSGTISTESFGLLLNLRNVNSSLITLGKQESSLYDGNLNYIPLMDGGMIGKVDYFSVGSYKLPTTIALFDSGVSTYQFRTEYAKDFIKQFNTADKINECSYEKYHSSGTNKAIYCRVGDFSRLPVLKIKVNGVSLKLDYTNYVDSCQRSSKEQSLPHDKGNWYCAMLFQSVDRLKASEGYKYQMIMGVPFFASNYMFFDHTNSKIGIAKNKNKVTKEQLLDTKYTVDKKKYKYLLK